MGQFNKLFSNFKLGELSPLAYASVTSEEYQQSCTQLLNMYPLNSGAAMKRSGTQFFKNMTDADFDNAAVIPFVDNNLNSYVVLIQGGLVTGTGTPLDWFAIYGIDGTTKTLTQYLPLSCWDLTMDLDPEGYHYAQVGEAIIITHNSGVMPPYILQKGSVSGSYDFTLIPFVNFLAPTVLIPSIRSVILNLPFRDKNISSTTLTPSGTTGNITVTASGALFTSAMVGTVFRIRQPSGTEGAFYITAYTSSLLVSATVIRTLGGTTATTDWTEAAWSDYRGWPRSIATYEQRTVFGGNNSQPEAVWGSYAGNYLLMMQNKLAQDVGSATDVSGLNYFGDDSDSDPYTFIPASGEPTVISWLASNRVLNVGSNSDEWIAKGINTILSKGSVDFKQQTNYGGNNSSPVKVNNEVVFISRNQKSLRTFQYVDSNGANTSIDLSSIAGHIHKWGGTKIGIKSIIFQKDKNIIWALNNNGQLVGLSYDKESGVIGWHKHTLGGSGVDIISIASIPDNTYKFDRLFMFLKRTVNGASAYYVEQISASFDADSFFEDTAIPSSIPVFLDSAITGTAIALQDTISGLDHLEDEEVTVTIDGIYYGQYTVLSGDITLDDAMEAGDKYVVGLPYSAILDTTDIEAGGDFGTSQGLTQRVHRATIKFYRTKQANIGSPQYGSLLETEVISSLGYEEVPINVSVGPELDQRIRIESTLPYPMTVVGVVGKGVSYE